jgi:hypothetical protein
MVNQPRPCARCRAPIPAERLELLPETQVCVKCSQEIGGEHKLVVTHEKTSKANSLRKNYGGVNVVRVPKRIPPLEK